MLQTEMTKILGIQYPIQCGTMGGGITNAEMVAAVANAGGFCCLATATYPTKDQFMDEVKKTRDMTDKPFGGNITLTPELAPSFTPEERIDWVVESGIKILESAGRSPEPYRQQIKDNGLIHIHKCARVRDAIKVDKMGVDMVSLVGTECGGHPSMEGVTTLVLIPAALDRISRPLIAGGGFCDGRGLIAAMALGAAGVNMGTRFMATKECPIHEDFKQKIIDTPETDTLVILKSLNNPSRVLRTPGAEKVLELENKGATLEEMIPHISGKVSARGWREANFSEGMFPGGQVVGRIRDNPTVAELIQRIIDEALEALEQISGR